MIDPLGGGAGGPGALTINAKTVDGAPPPREVLTENPGAPTINA
jgi:hypothetical protein